MTPKQKECLDFIAQFQKEMGFSPSYGNMRDELGYKSKSTISRLVLALEQRGFITRLALLARSIELTDKGKERIGNII